MFPCPSYFSHYNEGHHGEHGHCYLFSSCAWPYEGNCHDRCETHEVFDEDDYLEEKKEEDDMDSSETFGGEVGVERERLGPPGPRSVSYTHLTLPTKA